MRPAFGIARKLQLSLAALAVSLMLIGFAYWRVSAGNAATDQRVSGFQRDSARADALAQAFAEARRAQVDYAMSFNDRAAVGFRTAMRALAAQAAAQGAALPAPLQAALQDYQQAAQSLDERIGELGHDPDSGLQGQLRDAVHGVENLIDGFHVPALEVSMLTMRRHEKDFILRREQKYADELSEEAMPFELLLQHAPIPEPKRNEIRALMQQYQGAFVAYAASRFGLDGDIDAMDAAAAKVMPALQALRSRQASLLQAQRQAQASERTRMNVVFWGTLLLVAAMMTTLPVLVLRATVLPLREATAFACAIADDHLDGRLRIRNARDEIGQLSQALVQMQASLRRRQEAERATAAENLRVRQALDAAQANVMVVDADACVVYANRSLHAAFAAAGIGVDGLVGSAAAALDPAVAAHVQATRQAGAPQRCELALGDTQFVLLASPVLADGAVLGVAVEWQDRRLERVIEGEVSALVARAAAGHLGERIPLAGKDGFLAHLAGTINQLLDSVQQHLDEATVVIGRFAAGDLRARMRGDCQGVYARLQAGLDAAMAQVGTIVTGIQQSAGGVRAAADEMAAGTADLSSRAERQAGDVGQAGALMTAVAAEARQNLERAQASAVMAVAASDAARQGRDVAQAAISGMHGIRSASRRIREVVATVDSLAFQTNLLALNAAVEAARAGSHGKGFAVVAGEVRSLAQRSADAAQEIRRLIDGSLQQVESGATLVDSTGSTMDGILDKVVRVAEVMDEISDASARQDGAVTEVEQVLQRIGDGTGRNAALAEESSAAAASMRAQAEQLAAAAAAFVVGDDAQPGGIAEAA